VNPDVRLKKLPFFILEEVLVKPTTLVCGEGAGRPQEQAVRFSLTAAQLRRVTQSKQGKEFRQQVQLRLSLLDISCEQEDNFPSKLIVRVNGSLCSLPTPLPCQPGSEPRRPPGPLDITALLQLSPGATNTVTIGWTGVAGRDYTASLYLVERLTHQDLFSKLKQKGQRQPEFTKRLIREKLADQDSEIATTSVKVSLACPLGMMRMKTPCRASTCDHLQCFDAELYLMMNEKKPKWVCPVCNKPALMENLMIDGFFSDLLRSPRLPSEEHEIDLRADGGWEPRHTPAPVPAPRTKRSRQEFVTLDEVAAPGPASKRARPGRRPGPASRVATATVTPDIECIDID